MLPGDATSARFGSDSVAVGLDNASAPRWPSYPCMNHFAVPSLLCHASYSSLLHAVHAAMIVHDGTLDEDMRRESRDDGKKDHEHYFGHDRPLAYTPLQSITDHQAPFGYIPSLDDICVHHDDGDET